MVHAVGLVAAIFALGLALAQDVSMSAIATAASCALAALMLAVRFRVLDREGAPYLRVPGVAWMLARRAPGSFLDAARVALGSVGPAERLKPGFVRLRIGAASGLARAAHTAIASAGPGVVVADADESSVLLHVWSEPAALPASLLATEREAAAIIDGRGSP